MDSTLGAIRRPYLPGNPSSTATLINSPASVVSESSEAQHFPYKLQFPPTDQALVDCLKKKIHGASDDETNKILDFCLLDRQSLPNARDDGGICCLTKLSKLKNGGKNFNRKTKDGRCVTSHEGSLVRTYNEGEEVKLGIKTPFYYKCKDKKQIDRRLIKQYKLDRSQWPFGKENECEKSVLCHNYRKPRTKNTCVHNGSSSSITSGAEPSQNCSILGRGQTVAGIGYPSNMVSNPYDHQNQHDCPNSNMY